jgi:lipopolysaccharide export system permease protein
VSALDRTILKEIVGTFFGSVLLFTSLFLAADLLPRLVEYAGKGVSIGTLITLILFALPFVLAFTIPMAMLLATLLGFGRLSGDSEIVAMFATGASFWRIMRPVIAFALLIALPVIGVSQQLIPAAKHRAEELINDLKQNGGGVAKTNGRFSLVIDGDGETITLNALGGVAFGKSGKATLHNVSITVNKAGEPLLVAFAPEAVWKVGTRLWRLSAAGHPERLCVGNPTRGIWTTGENIQSKDREFALGTRDELQALEGHVQEQSTAALAVRAQLRRSEGKESEAREAELEAAGRFALPLATLVFALVGAPLGVHRTRSGKGVSFGYSVIITFAYWALMAVFKGSALSATLASQLPNLIGILVGGYLIARVNALGAVK